MPSPSFNMLSILLVLSGVVLLVLIIALARIKASLRQQAELQVSMQSDLRALCNAAVQVGERVNKLEGSLKSLQQRQEELGVRQDQMALNDPQDVSFGQAIRLARKGSSVEELMEVCSISRGEAELIAMMHRLNPEA